MDPRVVEALREGGIDPDPEPLALPIAFREDDAGRILPHGDTAYVVEGDKVVPVTLAAISDLFVGDRRPPDFSLPPPPEYLGFFLRIELAAASYCAVTGAQVRDKEFEQLYDDLRRRPDRRSDDVLFSHLQATLRLYLSLRDVSRAEYEAVLRRLAKSARTFAMGYTSMNYFEHALVPLLEAGGV
jgi:hypothetical protein